MKRLFILAAAVAATVACSKSEVNDINPLDPDVISFSPYAGAITKAVDATKENMGSVGIGIYAYETSIADSPMFISNDNATSTDGSSWSTKLTHYWPVTETTINFYGYYPYLSTATLSSAGVITNYTQIPQSAASQVDIMVSDIESQSSGTVCFNMYHALSAIDFNISVEDEDGVEVVVNSFAIEGVKTQHAGLDLVNRGFTMPTTAETLALETKYTYGTTKAFATALTVDATASSVDLSTQTGLSNNSTADGMYMLLPQTLTSWNTSTPTVAGARVVMNYTLKRNGTELLEDVDAAFPIPSTNEWKAGVKYLYTLTFKDNSNGGYDPDDGTELLAGQEIEFTVCTIDDWDTVSASDVEIVDL